MQVSKRKVAKVFAVLLGLYVGVVVLFEAVLGYIQPESDRTAVLTVQTHEGEPHVRVLSLLEKDGEYYVAANHWPRLWYRLAVANPEAQLKRDGQTLNVVAMPVAREEHARVDDKYELALRFRILTGFPPRRFLRLDPVDGA